METYYIYKYWNPQEVRQKIRNSNLHIYLVSKKIIKFTNEEVNNFENLVKYFYNDETKYKELVEKYPKLSKSNLEIKDFYFNILVSENIREKIIILEKKDYLLDDMEILDGSKIKVEKNDTIKIQKIDDNLLKEMENEDYVKLFNGKGSKYYHVLCFRKYLKEGKTQTIIKFKKKTNDDEYADLWEDINHYPYLLLIKKKIAELNFIYENQEKEIQLVNNQKKFIIDQRKRLSTILKQNTKIKNCFFENYVTVIN